MTSSELVDLITREFPGFSVLVETDADGDQYVMWRGHGPKPEDPDFMCVVGECQGQWQAFPFTEAKRGAFTDLLTAAEYATGEVALSRRDNPPEPRKNFTQKPRIDLIPPGVLSRHVLPVLHDGAQKHGRDHWRKCTQREYALAAATHVLAYLDGEETDESGHAALAHAAADLLLALGAGS